MTDELLNMRKKSLLSFAAMLSLGIGYITESPASATFKIDDTKWVSIGAGLRANFQAAEQGAGQNGDQWHNDFNLDNIRLFLNGQIYQYVKLELNTDCANCGNGGELRILDAIGKFEYNPMVNIWFGRLLVPAERREMNGPFFNAIYNTFSSGTPFEPADFNTTFKSDGTSAGAVGRDHGATIWGAALDGHLQYAVGFFRGLRGGANADDNLLYAQRFAYNFWQVEKNPGYYTSGTYYGKGGDILTLAVSNQYQASGAGTVTDQGNFRGTTADVLMEKVLDNNAVVTLNGEYKNYEISGGYNQASRNAGGGFAMFQGNAYDVSGLYLFPQKIGFGLIQPYVRYVNVAPSGSSNRESYEAGLNYIIDGHNARVSLSWEYGDIMSKGLNYTTSASGDHTNAIKLGLQWQL
ncbi:MAG: hypothetical protein QX197_13465 [Methylococcaceae bacterium]